MRVAEGWNGYRLLDATNRRRLELWGDYCLVRPDPQVVWKTPKSSPRWSDPDAVYNRSREGGGSWKFNKKPPGEWVVDWNGAVKMQVTPTGFKHTGVFPEQAANWALYTRLIKAANRPINVLNLFGYTGGASLACLSAGAAVCHVDASRGMVAQAKQNAALSGLSGRPIRYIVDDCAKFISREIKRGVRYDGVIMDPPSYGRGPSGEMWKLEDNIYDLVSLCKGALCERPLFFAVNSYTTGLAPAVTHYILASLLPGEFGGTVESGEVGLTVESTGLALPCGSTALFIGT